MTLLTDQLQVGVARGVALAVAAGAVELEAVELDGEPLVRPVGVDLVGAGLSFHQGIEERARNVGVVLEKQPEASLELAPLGARPVRGDRLSQRPCPTPSVGTVQHIDDRLEVEETEPLRAIDGHGEIRRPNDSTEVE